MNSPEHISTIIIGGGILGLQIGYKLSQTSKNYDFCILDKEMYLGEHSSGRNSGVLHAGLYYQDNSLKKKYCLAGLEKWKAFCVDNNLFYNNSGKYIFTTIDNEYKLNDLFERAKKNSPNVRKSSKKEVQSIQEYCYADIAFYSPDSSIIDPSESISFLKNHFESLDIPILLNQDIKLLGSANNKFHILVDGEEFTCDFLINAAGNGAIDLRKQLELNNFDNYFVKGHYVRSSSKFYNESLLYSLPEENLKGLGVHTCIDADGSIKFGPDTLDVSSISYDLNHENIEKLKQDVCSKFKISVDKLRADYSGIRTKLLQNQKLYSDFWIGFKEDHGIDNYIELLGIESPGLTSSPAIAEEIVKRIAT